MRCKDGWIGRRRIPFAMVRNIDAGYLHAVDLRSLLNVEIREIVESQKYRQ